MWSADCRVANAEKYRMKRDYHINAFFSANDEGYIADIPDLRHCSAFGGTPVEALREVLQAKRAWIEAARANKKPIPKPRYRPAIYHTI
jgi:predicted RNase H-like HicB family nuclease